MHGLLARQTAVIGAVAAAGLLLMQLRTEGVRGYGVPDILSILLVAVPVMARRSSRPRRPHGAGADTPAGANASDGDAEERSATGADEDTGARLIVERLLARWVAMLVAVGAWTGAVLLVLLQAWPPALSALIVMAIAASGIPADRDDMPVAHTSGPG
ncbi:MAG TPA: hypothetical protein VFZ70_12420 [Euzebyales bacterium]